MNFMFGRLKPHVGHKLACVTYGDPEDPTDICIECEDCGEVLISAESFYEYEGEREEEEPAIKPCPFCGSKPVINRTSAINTPSSYSVGYQIECPKCHVYFGSRTDIHIEKGLPIVDNNGYKECIDMWNQRVNKED